MKLRGAKHCVLSVHGNENDDFNADSNNIIITMKDTKLYVPIATLLANYNQKLLNPLSKDLKDWCIGMIQNKT